MTTTRKLIVKRLPKKVCISISTTKGRTLTKKKYVRRGRKRTVSRRRKRKTTRARNRRLKVGKVRRCTRRSNKSKLVCTRLARAGCLTSKGTLKRKKICRSMSRNRGLKPKTGRSRRRALRRSSLEGGVLPIGMSRFLQDLL